MDLSMYHEAVQQRLHGPVLSGLTAKSLFAGDEAAQRMTAIRHNITEVRSHWRNTDEYKDLVNRLESTLYNDQQSTQLKSKLSELLAGYHDWADYSCERPGGTNLQPWAFIELYSSKEGYDFLYGLFNTILRLPDADKDKLLAAAFLTEILTIELYNLRLSNICDPMYENYQGKVYRGLSVGNTVAEDFRKAAQHPDLSQRNFAIPLGFISTSTAKVLIEEFAKGQPGDEEMYWIVHVHGLEPHLLRRYEERYPESVVTSVCAMPIATIASFGEREILLRGAWFHILRMDTEKRGGNVIHTVEMVMLNANRDHGTELASHIGDKLVQRKYFNSIILASRYKTCASLTKAYSSKDSVEYDRLAEKALADIEAADEEWNSLYNVDNRTLTHKMETANPSCSSMATWIGGCTGRSFPRHYLARRKLFHKAARQGEWSIIKSILDFEYDRRQTDWFNVVEVSAAIGDPPSRGYTLLHEIASQGRPSRNSPQNLESWEYIIEMMGRREVWRTIRSSGNMPRTPEEIAKQHGHYQLLSKLKPKLYHQIPDKALVTLQKQLIDMMKEYAQEQLEESNFQMPQLSVLTEIKDSELWIPVPGLYGGFLIKLREQALCVTLCRTLAGRVKSYRQEFELSFRSMQEAS